MNKLSEDELKEAELNILLKIDNICRIQQIDYSLCGGTLLGAVRHRGFIPWDDDIDITMTRSNYNKFICFLKDNPVEGISLIDYCSKNYGYMFSKVCDSHTKLVEHHNKPIEELGIFVDVFPVDYLGNSFEESRKIMFGFRFKKYLLAAWNWKSFFYNKGKNGIRQLLRFVFFIMSRFIGKKKLIESMNKRIAKLNKEKQFSGCLFGSYESKDIFKTELFYDFCDIEFEGHVFMCFKEYDEYLKSLYGNYMVLPPKDKQVSHHTFDAFLR